MFKELSQCPQNLGPLEIDLSNGKTAAVNLNLFYYNNGINRFRRNYNTNSLRPRWIPPPGKSTIVPSKFSGHDEVPARAGEDISGVCPRFYKHHHPEKFPMCLYNHYEVCKKRIRPSPNTHNMHLNCVKTIKFRLPKLNFFDHEEDILLENVRKTQTGLAKVLEVLKNFSEAEARSTESQNMIWNHDQKIKKMDYDLQKIKKYTRGYKARRNKRFDGSEQSIQTVESWRDTSRSMEKLTKEKNTTETREKLREHRELRHRSEEDEETKCKLYGNSRSEDKNASPSSKQKTRSRSSSQIKGRDRREFLREVIDRVLKQPEVRNVSKLAERDLRTSEQLAATQTDYYKRPTRERGSEELNTMHRDAAHPSIFETYRRLPIIDEEDLRFRNTNEEGLERSKIQDRTSNQTHLPGYQQGKLLEDELTKLGYSALGQQDLQTTGKSTVTSNTLLQEYIGRVENLLAGQHKEFDETQRRYGSLVDLLEPMIDRVTSEKKIGKEGKCANGGRRLEHKDYSPARVDSFEESIVEKVGNLEKHIKRVQDLINQNSVITPEALQRETLRTSREEVFDGEVQISTSVPEEAVQIYQQAFHDLEVRYREKLNLAAQELRQMHELLNMAKTKLKNRLFQPCLISQFSTRIEKNEQWGVNKANPTFNIMPKMKVKSISSSSSSTDSSISDTEVTLPSKTKSGFHSSHHFNSDSLHQRSTQERSYLSSNKDVKVASVASPEAIIPKEICRSSGVEAGFPSVSHLTGVLTEDSIKQLGTPQHASSMKNLTEVQKSSLHPQHVFDLHGTLAEDSVRRLGTPRYASSMKSLAELQRRISHPQDISNLYGTLTEDSIRQLATPQHASSLKSSTRLQQLQEMHPQDAFSLSPELKDNIVRQLRMPEDINSTQDSTAEFQPMVLYPESISQHATSMESSARFQQPQDLHPQGVSHLAEELTNTGVRQLRTPLDTSSNQNSTAEFQPLTFYQGSASYIPDISTDNNNKRKSGTTLNASPMESSAEFQVLTLHPYDVCSSLISHEDLVSQSDSETSVHARIRHHRSSTDLSLTEDQISSVIKQIATNRKLKSTDT